MSQIHTKFLRLPNVLERVGLSRSELYRRVQAGIFPRPIKVGVRAVAWVEADIDAWTTSCIDRNRDNHSEQADTAVPSNRGGP